MEYYLKADTKEELLNDLRSAGFEWYDYDETGNRTETRDPKKHEIVTVRHLGSCIYLEHLQEKPAVYSEDGETLLEEPVFTTTFHANALMDKSYDFSTSMEQRPSSPKYGWAI